MKLRGRGTISPATLFVLALALAGMVLSSVSPAWAEIVNCYNLWPEADRTSFSSWGEWTDDAGNPVYDMPCEEYKPQEVRRKFAEFGTEVHIYVYTPRGAETDPRLRTPNPYATPHAPELVMKALYDSMKKLAPSLPGVPITAMLLPVVRGQSDGADGPDWQWNVAADARRGLRPCPVSVYLNAVMKIPEDGSEPYPRDPVLVKAVIAHEVFHCYQHEYFPDQMDAWQEDRYWWSEGTAMHLATLIYDCPWPPQMTGDYDRTSPVYHQGKGYPNVAFFGYLGKDQGFDVAEMVSLLGSMPKDGGIAAQRRALAAFPGMGEKFHGYARQFVDKSTPCFGASLTTRDYPTTPIEGRGTVSYSAGPFAIDLQDVLLARDATYRVRLEPGTGAPDEERRISFRQMGQKGWVSIGEGEFELQTSCTGDPYMFVVSNAGTGGAAFSGRLSFERDESEKAEAGLAAVPDVKALCGEDMKAAYRKSCGYCAQLEQSRGEALDNCLVGGWELVTGAREIEAEKMDQGKLAEKGVAFAVESAANRYLFFREDGSLVHNASDTTVTMIAGDARMVTSQKVGPGSGYWDTKGAKLAICMVGDIGKEERVAYVDGHAVPAPPMSRAEREHVWGGGLTYSCNATDLTVTKSAFGYSATWHYRRVGRKSRCPE